MSTGNRSKSEPVERLELHLKYLFDHGVNFKDRVITLASDIDEDEFLRIDAALTEMESHNKSNITIRINSGGGSVYDALAIVGRIKRSKAHITTEGYGAVMSAATLILASGKVRKFSKFGWWMFHETQHEYEEGTRIRTSQLEAELAQEKREHELWCNAMAEFSNKDKGYWLSRGVYVDQYFSPEELLDLGVVDEIL